jgi:CubicO group peptidase (beta-lactamase class C family)
MQERIFRPLGMSSMRKISTFNPMAGSASGYAIDGGATKAIKATEGQTRMFAMGAGGLEMSVMDLAKWDASLYTTQVLKAAAPSPNVADSLLDARTNLSHVSGNSEWIVMLYLTKPDTRSRFISGS